MSKLWESSVLLVSEPAPGIRRIVLERPRGLEWLPGQGLAVDVGRAAKNPVYAIATTPETIDRIELMVDVNRRGRGAEFMGRLNVGDRVRFQAPVGYFALERAPGAPVAFLACQLGIAAIRPMVLRLLRHRLTFPVRLHHFVQTLQEQLFRDDFIKAVFQLEKFEYEVLFDIPVREYVDGRYVSGTDRRDWRFYVCGPAAQVTEACALLQRGGYPPEAICAEPW